MASSVLSIQFVPVFSAVNLQTVLRYTPATTKFTGLDARKKKGLIVGVYNEIREAS
jgi:hypothetical protein